MSFQGIDVLNIDVEVQIASGLPAFTIVGYINLLFLLSMLLFSIPSAIAAENYPTKVSNEELSSLYQSGNLDEMRAYAEAGNVKAQTWLGLMLHNRADYAGAMKWYSIAGTNGDSWAISQIIFLYERGLGRSKNYIAAAEWQRKGAERGFANHQVEYALRLLDGTRGVPKDEAGAFKWLSAAAKQKFIDAYFHLAIMQSEKNNPNYDPVKAYAYAKYYTDHAFVDSLGDPTRVTYKIQKEMKRILSEKQIDAANDLIERLGS